MTVVEEAHRLLKNVREPPPLPAPALRDGLLGLDVRARRCVLVHVLERSIAARRPLLVPWFDPDDLAEHVVRALDWLLAGEKPDDDDWLRWTAGFFRWTPIRRALRREVEAGCGDAPQHPDTEKWAAMGMRLEGATQAEQFAELRAHPSYGTGQQNVVVGDAKTSGLAAALTELAGSSAADGVARALALSCRKYRADLVVPRIAGPLQKHIAEDSWDAR